MLYREFVNLLRKAFKTPTKTINNNNSIVLEFPSQNLIVAFDLKSLENLQHSTSSSFFIHFSHRSASPIKTLLWYYFVCCQAEEVNTVEISEKSVKILYDFPLLCCFHFSLSFFFFWHFSEKLFRVPSANIYVSDFWVHRRLKAHNFAENGWQSLAQP